MSPAEPEKFGKYELLKRLAFGGMAEIFLARLIGERGFSKQLVVKRILPQFGEDAQFVKMFIDEAVLAAYINHPNVVQVYDFGSTDNVYFIAMEFVDGADLKQVLRHQLKKGTLLSAAAVAAIGEGVAAGLASAHVATDPDGVDLKLVHRDVSPHNVMIGRGGDVKVMDFGIARAEVRATKTATGTIKGKVAYMAPEHGSGEKADGRSDQFSLGAVLWEALAGERLYGGDSELEVLRNVLDCRVRDIREVRKDVPDALAAVVMRMLEREPSARFATLLEVRDELSRFRFTLGADGAVDLGKLVSVVQEAPTKRSSGTLVLDESPAPDAPTAPVTDDKTLRAEGPSEGVITATMDSETPVIGTMATTPMQTDSTLPSSTAQAVTESRPSKLWALSLVVLIGAGLLWISQQGQARMDMPAGNKEMSIGAVRALPVSSSPNGAQIWVDGQNTNQVTPATLEPRGLGTSFKLELKLTGHEVWQSEVTVTVQLKNVSAQLQVTQPAARAKAPSKSVKPRGIRPASKGNVARKHKITTEPKPVKSQPGRLFLRSGGLWFHVYLEGKKIGTTPLAGVSVPAGRHSLTLKNEVAGVEREISVQVDPGATVRRTIAP